MTGEPINLHSLMVPLSSQGAGSGLPAEAKPPVRVGRPKIYATDAERQRAYRARQKKKAQEETT